MSNQQNDEIVETFKSLLGKLSYYNAGEGPTWKRETEERRACQSQLKATAQKIKELGLDPLEILRTGNFLVHESELR